MVERSNKKNVDEQTLASFKISQKLWQRFQARCIEDQIKIAEVLSQLIADYLDEIGESSVKSLDKLINQRIRETVEQYLQQNLETQLETQVLKTVENRLNELIENSIEHQPQSNRSQTPKTPSPEEIQPTPPQPKKQPATLKTAKELGEILGVSAPYITTLNRIGELQQKGWEDSGKRKGKTILYKPID